MDLEDQKQIQLYLDFIFDTLEKEKKEKKEQKKTFKNSTLYLACQYYQDVENSFENIKTLLDLGFRL